MQWTWTTTVAVVSCPSTTIVLISSIVFGMQNGELWRPLLLLRGNYPPFLIQPISLVPYERFVIHTSDFVFEAMKLCLFCTKWICKSPPSFHLWSTLVILLCGFSLSFLIETNHRVLRRLCRNKYHQLVWEDCLRAKGSLFWQRLVICSCDSFVLTVLLYHLDVGE